MKKKFLVALPAFPKEKGFCHQTVLVRAVDRDDAAIAARRIKGDRVNIGDIKEVDY